MEVLFLVTKRGFSENIFVCRNLGFGCKCEGNPPQRIMVIEITKNHCAFLSDGSLLYTSLKPSMKCNTLMWSFCCWKGGFNSNIDTPLICPIEANRNPIRITLKCPVPRPAVVFGSYGQESRILCGIWRVNSSQSQLCALPVLSIFCIKIWYCQSSPVFCLWQGKTHTFGVLEGHGVIRCDYFQSKLFAGFIVKHDSLKETCGLSKDSCVFLSHMYSLEFSAITKSSYWATEE